MDNVNDENKLTAEDTAEAEKTGAAAGLGKFQSVDALLNAYQALEAEFTRRSQRLKELESGNKAQRMPEEGAPSRDSIPQGDLLNAALSDERVKEAVIGEYLKTVAANKSVPLIAGGIGSAAPKSAPKSVKEAGALVKQFLNN